MIWRPGFVLAVELYCQTNCVIIRRLRRAACPGPGEW
jgi:hypothetical protein